MNYRSSRKHNLDNSLCRRWILGQPFDLESSDMILFTAEIMQVLPQTEDRYNSDQHNMSQESVVSQTAVQFLINNVFDESSSPERKGSLSKHFKRPLKKNVIESFSNEVLVQYNTSLNKIILVNQS